MSQPPSGDCAPFAYADVEGKTEKVPIAPCGAIANSLFNGKSIKNSGFLKFFNKLNFNV